MNIAWVTPFVKKSAIARFSQLVTNMLIKRGHLITIIRCEAAEILSNQGKEAELFESEAKIMTWIELKQSLSVQNFDVCIYNVGDYFSYHSGAIELIKDYPGAVIFHDYFLLGLLTEWSRMLKTPEIFNQVMDRLYGTGAGKKVEKSLNKIEFYSETAEHFPGTEWIAEMALGAIAHSEFYKWRLESSCSGPVTKISMAYNSLREYSSLAAKLNFGKINILTVGNININKRIESILTAIGSSTILREKSFYNIVGFIADNERERLNSIATELNLNNYQIVGSVTDKELEFYYEGSDIICCLRHPVLEGASASAIEGMLAGRPIIVTNAGFYQDLPDDIVYKVNMSDEVNELRLHLEHLVTNKKNREIFGEKAKIYAVENFNAENYAKKLEFFLEDVIQAKLFAQLTKDIAQMMLLLKIDGNDPFIKRISDTMHSLFDVK